MFPSLPVLFIGDLMTLLTLDFRENWDGTVCSSPLRPTPPVGVTPRGFPLRLGDLRSSSVHGQETGTIDSYSPNAASTISRASFWI